MPHDETIDILSYLRRLSRHLVPALVAAVVVGSLLGLLLHFTGMGKSPVEGKAHVLVYPQKVSTEAEATQQAQLIPMMLRTYVALDAVPAYTQAVSDATGGRFTPEQVAQKLTIYWGGGSALLAFQTEGATQEDADLLANKAAEVFVAKSNTIVPLEDWKPTLKLAEPSSELSASEDGAPAGGSSPLMLPVAGVLGTFGLALLVLEALSAQRERRRQATVTGASAAR